MPTNHETASRYGRLLEPLRPRDSTSPRASTGLEALSDKSRIIGSPAFHRMQSKAQVFSLARSGAVRTRLTHSIEVSNFGELIAESIAEKLVPEALLPEHRLPFVQTVENACLLHDIGNPPFGHMGEAAIADWFKLHAADLLHAWGPSLPTDNEAGTYLNKLKNFDGNPQGLRIISRLQWFHDENGMNLTCPLIAAYMKYIGDKVDENVDFHKKLGFFPSEADVVRFVWGKLDLKRNESGLPAQRHPLAYIMEAADDIAYSLSDIEDALERRVVSEAHVLDTLNKDLEDDVAEARALAERVKEFASNNPAFHALRLRLSRQLVEAAANAYLDAHDAVFSGALDKPLLSTNVQAAKILKCVKNYSRANVYSHREVVDMELGGLRALSEMLERYRSMLRMAPDTFQLLRDRTSKTRFQKHSVEVLLYELLPKKQLKVYDWQTRQRPQYEPVFRTQLVVDYISGMTDSHAIKVYNIMNGTQPFGIE
jgi:dGTPase